MSQEMVISSNPIETTVAILEDDRLVEIYVEHHAQKALGGSIYKGRVTRVLPGMQSAFVNLGLRRDAFLYVTDVLDPSEDIEEDPDARLIQPDATSPMPPDYASELDVVAAKEAGGEDQPGPTDASAADAEDAPRRSRRRSRRRRRSGKGAGEVEAGNGSEPTDEPQPADGASRLTVLPEESIAKYSTADQGDDDSSGSASPTDSVSGSSAEVDPAPQSRPKVPVASEVRSTDESDADRSAAGSPSDSEPPRLSASVQPPPTVAEFRLRAVDWLKRKLTGSAEPKAVPAPERARKRSSRRRSPKPRTSKQPQARPTPGVPDGPAKSRPSRRPTPTRRPRNQRVKASSKRSAMPERAQQASAQANIGDLLEVGQELVVQVNKEPVDSKGARITSHVSLPGRYMVYMTTAKHNGVARTIQPESERNRLRKIVDKHSAGREGGFVVRTAGRGVSEEVLIADMEFLHQQWTDLKAKAEKRKAPATLHSDLDIVERILRDNLGQSYKSIWVDSEPEFQRILQFVKRHQPELADRVKRYTRSKPIHESFGIKKDLEKALKPKVWLKSGGYIVIDQTEALVAIDVNTGRYVGKSNRLEDTVLKTNLEAAEEIIRQLRLRDLGGIIVIDFIDMEDRKNRQSVQQVLQEALKNSRSPTRLLPFNDFGLVVITRKAVRQSLERALCMPCPCCSGSGKVKSVATVMSEIFATADRMASKQTNGGNGQGKGLTLRVHPEIAKSIKKRSNSYLQELETLVGSNVSVRSDSSMHPERFNLA